MTALALFYNRQDVLSLPSQAAKYCKQALKKLYAIKRGFSTFVYIYIQANNAISPGLFIRSGLLRTDQIIARWSDAIALIYVQRIKVSNDQ
jgi:hypothetical protein